MGFIGDLFGGAPKADVSRATSGLEESKRKATKARTALYETPGASTGEEVEDVKKRQTLLGN